VNQRRWAGTRSPRPAFNSRQAAIPWGRVRAQRAIRLRPPPAPSTLRPGAGHGAVPGPRAGLSRRQGLPRIQIHVQQPARDPPPPFREGDPGDCGSARGGSTFDGELSNQELGLLPQGHERPWSMTIARRLVDGRLPGPPTHVLFVLFLTAAGMQQTRLGLERNPRYDRVRRGCPRARRPITAKRFRDLLCAGPRRSCCRTGR